MGGQTPEGCRREGHCSGLLGEGSLQGQASRWSVLCVWRPHFTLASSQPFSCSEATWLDCTPSPVLLASPSLTLHIQENRGRPPVKMLLTAGGQL